MADGQSGELFAPANEQHIGADQERAGSCLGQSRKGRIEVVFGAGMQDMELKPEGAGRFLQIFRCGLGSGMWSG